MKNIEECLESMNQTQHLARRVDKSMKLLASEVYMAQRLDESLAVDKVLIQDYICAFCLCFVFDPVMCSECEHVFCLECQQTYYRKQENVTCSLCRQKPQDEFKPLNKKLRKKFKRLQFECRECKSVIGVNDKGNGQGQHTDSCRIELKYKCACGHIFNAVYAEMKVLVQEHLVRECYSIMCQSTRRLTRVVNRFEELGVPQVLIDFYKSLEPFYFFDDRTTFDEPGGYVSKLDFKQKKRYEGEIVKEGFQNGKGMEFFEDDIKFTIVEGSFVKGVGNHGLTRNFAYEKATQKASMMMGYTIKKNFNGVCSMVTSNNEFYYGHVVEDKRNGVGKIQFVDGSIYIGESKNDQRHGKGALYMADAPHVCMKGLFINDVFKQPYDYDDTIFE